MTMKAQILKYITTIFTTTDGNKNRRRGIIFSFPLFIIYFLAAVTNFVQ